MKLTLAFSSSRFLYDQESEDKNWNIFRTRGEFEIKRTPFFIICEGLSDTRNCLKSEGGALLKVGSLGVGSIWKRRAI